MSLLTLIVLPFLIMAAVGGVAALLFWIGGKQAKKLRESIYFVSLKLANEGTAKPNENGTETFGAIGKSSVEFSHSAASQHSLPKFQILFKKKFEPDFVASPATLLDVDLFSALSDHTRYDLKGRNFTLSVLKTSEYVFSEAQLESLNRLINFAAFNGVFNDPVAKTIVVSFVGYGLVSEDLGSIRAALLEFERNF